MSEAETPTRRIVDGRNACSLAPTSEAQRSRAHFSGAPRRLWSRPFGRAIAALGGGVIVLSACSGSELSTGLQDPAEGSAQDAAVIQSTSTASNDAEPMVPWRTVVEQAEAGADAGGDQTPEPTAEPDPPVEVEVAQAEPAVAEPEAAEPVAAASTSTSTSASASSVSAASDTAASEPATDPTPDPTPEPEAEPAPAPTERVAAVSSTQTGEVDEPAIASAPAAPPAPELVRDRSEYAAEVMALCFSHLNADADFRTLSRPSAFEQINAQPGSLGYVDRNGPVFITLAEHACQIVAPASDLETAQTLIERELPAIGGSIGERTRQEDGLLRVEALDGAGRRYELSIWRIEMQALTNSVRPTPGVQALLRRM